MRTIGLRRGDPATRGAGDRRALPGGPVPLGAAAAAAPGAVRGGLRHAGRRRVLRRGARAHQGRRSARWRRSTPCTSAGRPATGWSASAPTRCATCSAARRSTTRSPSTSASGTTRPPPDGTITLEHAECLAACDYGPVMTVNYDFFDRVDRTARSGVVEPAAARASGRSRRRGARLCTLKEMSLQLAGFADEPRRARSPTASAGRRRRCAALRLAQEHGDRRSPASTRRRSTDAVDRDTPTAGRPKDPAPAVVPAAHKPASDRKPAGDAPMPQEREAQGGRRVSASPSPRGAGQAHPGADQALAVARTPGSSTTTSSSTATRRCARRWRRTRTT